MQLKSIAYKLMDRLLFCTYLYIIGKKKRKTHFRNKLNVKSYEHANFSTNTYFITVQLSKVESRFYV